MTDIRYDIPAPPMNDRPGRKYPWLELKVGGSFQFEGKYPHQSAHAASKQYKRKFRAGKHDGVYRIWRVS